MASITLASAPQRARSWEPPQRGQGDAAAGNGQSVAVGRRSDGRLHILEIVERLAHAHEHDIRDLAVLSQGQRGRGQARGTGPFADAVAGDEDLTDDLGCTLNCSFCHTGTQRLVRNLEAAEIVGQILLARDRIGDWPGASAPGDGRLLPVTDRKITNIVLMGMGEPLYNFDNVRRAIEVAADGEGLSVSKRRITLSTSGVVPEIPRWGAETGTMLAISLHAVRNDLRDELVPINKKYPIAELLEACRDYPSLSNARRITFEYVMLKGVNDSIAEAKALVRLLAGIPAKINLIPFNPWPGTPYECSDWEQIERFAEVVNKAGYASPVRTPRGRDILAACGQLRSESVKLRAAERGTDAASSSEQA